MLVTLFKIVNAFAPTMEQEQGEIFVGERTIEAPAAAAAWGSGAAAMHGGPSRDSQNQQLRFLSSTI